MIKRSLIDRVIAKFTEGLPNDFDMVHLFPNREPLEDMEDAYEGDTEVMPKKTLRNRYMQQPLMLRPEYKGDILEQFGIRKPGIRPENIINSDDQTNLKDFTDPEEMLKHQEEPYPRVVVDDFIQFDTPDPGRGNQTLKDYDDRGWVNEEAPEVSEDLIDRLRGKGVPRVPKTFKVPKKAPARVAMAFLSKNSKPDPTAVVASFLSKTSQAPNMTLEKLKNSEINGKKIWGRGDPRDPRMVLVAPSVDKMHTDSEHGLWSFKTGKSFSYFTTFQFTPRAGVENVTDLDVKVNCTCNSWHWYGGIYNAYSKKFLYGPVHFPPPPPPPRPPKPPYTPLLKKPDIRDPGGKFIACKHMLACIPWLEDNKLPYPEAAPAPGRIVEIKEDVKDEDLRTSGMPSWLRDMSRDLATRINKNNDNAIKRWKDLSPEERDTVISNLTAYQEMIYLGYLFPATAAPRMPGQLDLWKQKNPKLWKGNPGLQARINSARMLFNTNKNQVLEKMHEMARRPGERSASVEMNEESLKKTWLGMSKNDQRKFVESLDDPESVYSVFLMFPRHALDLVLERLRDMLDNPKTKEKAEEYLGQLIS